MLQASPDHESGSEHREEQPFAHPPSYARPPKWLRTCTCLYDLRVINFENKEGNARAYRHKHRSARLGGGYAYIHIRRSTNATTGEATAGAATDKLDIFPITCATALTLKRSSTIHFLATDFEVHRQHLLLHLCSVAQNQPLGPMGSLGYRYPCAFVARPCI
jgi:hypothetical protein